MQRTGTFGKPWRSKQHEELGLERTLGEYPPVPWPSHTQEARIHLTRLAGVKCHIDLILLAKSSLVLPFSNITARRGCVGVVFPSQWHLQEKHHI